MTFSDRMRNLRNMRGLKQEDVARATGIPVNYISSMETGKVIPAGEWETAIRNALGWTPEVDTQLEAFAQGQA